MRKAGLIVAAALVASPAMAKVKFEKYVGPPAIMTGHGGTVSDNHGIEIWTSGAPDRRYEYLGTINDDRQDKLLSGNAMNSSAIAKKVREVGGDALIVGPRSREFAGVIASGSVSTYGNQSYGFGGGRVVHDVSTTFAVIRYLKD